MKFYGPVHIIKTISSFYINPCFFNLGETGVEWTTFYIS